ncbi:hypothetical protein M5G27_03995, partial [Pseudomonas shahriarae]|nr:hypothetical protein [Pseudomonas shahriarae]
MKRQTLLSIAFSVFAVNAFAATPAHTMIAADGADRVTGAPSPLTVLIASKATPSPLTVLIVSKATPSPLTVLIASKATPS